MLDLSLSLETNGIAYKKHRKNLMPRQGRVAGAVKKGLDHFTSAFSKGGEPGRVSVSLGRTGVYSSSIWHLYLIAGTLALVAYPFIHDPVLQYAWFSLFGFATCLAIVTGIVMYRPARWRAWGVLALGFLTLNLAAPLWVYFQAALGYVPYPSVADIFGISGYIIIAAALFALFRGRIPGGLHAGIIDSLLITLVVGMAAWVYVLDPMFDAQNSSWVSALVGTAYPVCDVLILGVGARLFMVSGRRSMALNLLGVGFLAYLGADVLNTVISLNGYQTFLPQLFWAGGFVVFGAAVLHPSMREVSRPPRMESDPLNMNIHRLVILGVAGFGGAITQATQLGVGDAADLLIMIATSTALFVLVLSRLLMIVRDLKTALDQRGSLEGQLRDQSLRDSLTGLANRPLFIKTVDRALRSPGTVAVLFLDLDDFQIVNETLDREAGDHLLQEAGRRITKNLRLDDLPARLGGDEFGLLLAGYPNQAAVEAVANRLLSTLGRIINLDGHAISPQASIGVAIADGSSDRRTRYCEMPRQLRASPRNLARTVCGSLAFNHAEVMERVQAKEDLARGIAAGEIVSYYQPIVDLASGVTVGAESLARWKHPTLGPVSPAEFIPLAEASGLIVQLGNTLLEQACEKAAHWPLGPSGQPLELHVNDCSAAQYGKYRVGDRAHLAHTGFARTAQSRGHRIHLGRRVGPGCSPRDS